MKNICIFCLISIIGLFFSCSDNNEQLDRLKNNSLMFEDFFDQVSSMKLKTNEENVIYIDYVWNKKDNTITLKDYKESEPDFFIIENSSKLKELQSKKRYQVSCNNGGASWDKECAGKISCGRLIGECLDQGGCAEICTLKMAYAPQNNTFYLL
ncbi:MAG: hypothetical protein L3J45_07900 [Flavobacteriaceae bacterium]|nr:hypothetical protein [Flavobacteriaceae bacterium]